MEYESAPVLFSQYVEIFSRRQYAFQARTDAPVILDAGGNIGMSAVWFKREYPRAQLTVFEADPELAAMLSRNLSAAGMRDVAVENAAVWTHEGTVIFDNRGLDKGAVGGTGGIRVASIDLAARITGDVDLLKLDVEGAEFALLERLHATGALARVRHMIAEFHVRETDLERVLIALRQLRESGMQVRFISSLGPFLGESGSRSPFEAVGAKQELMEVYAWR